MQRPALSCLVLLGFVWPQRNLSHTCIELLAILVRAGQDQGGSTLNKKAKSTKLIHIVLWYTKGVVAYDFLCGLHSSNFYSSKGQTKDSHFNFYRGTNTTIRNYVYILGFCVPQIDLYHQLCNWQVKRLIKQRKLNVSFLIFENTFEHVTRNTQFWRAQIRVAPFIHIMLQVCHCARSSYRCTVTLLCEGI